MLIDKKEICPQNKYYYVGDSFCAVCQMNSGEISGKDINKIDCSYEKVEGMIFSPEEVDLLRQAYNHIKDQKGYWLEDNDRVIMDRIKAFQKDLIEKSAGKKVKLEKGLGKTGGKNDN